MDPFCCEIRMDFGDCTTATKLSQDKTHDNRTFSCATVTKQQSSGRRTNSDGGCTGSVRHIRVYYISPYVKVSHLRQDVRFGSCHRRTSKGTYSFHMALIADRNSAKKKTNKVRPGNKSAAAAAEPPFDRKGKA